MAAVIGSDQWWEERKQARLTAREATSAEFFESGDTIPDIDFSVDCPICSEPLDCDESFFCRVCHVTWQRNGYGHEARREDQF